MNDRILLTGNDDYEEQQVLQCDSLIIKAGYTFLNDNGNTELFDNVQNLLIERVNHKPLNAYLVPIAQPYLCDSITIIDNELTLNLTRKETLTIPLCSISIR